jgi:hypothetical protein
MAWSVSLKDSGDNMKDGFATELDAYYWLAANVPHEELNLCIVEPEEDE